MSNTFAIDIDLSGVIPPGGLDGALPSLARAISLVAEAAQGKWQKYASGVPLPNGDTIHARSGQYLRSIQMRPTGKYAAEVYSDLPYAEYIESGSPARDLKRMLSTSHKTRISKKGKRYLIIPFRHGTAGTVSFQSSMPDEMSQLIRQMKPSRVLRSSRVTVGHDIESRKPLMVTRRKYKWGDRLTQDQLRGAGVYGKKARHLTGLVRMQNQTGNGSKDTQYLTFRVMTEDSTGWLVREQPGKWPARTTADLIRPEAEKIIQAAVEADFNSHFGLS